MLEKLNLIQQWDKSEYRDILADLIFYCKILLEPGANNKSYRHNYALEVLRLARTHLDGRINWLDLPIKDIDKFGLPDKVKEKSKLVTKSKEAVIEVERLSGKNNILDMDILIPR